jgi:hypothetical protein
MADPQKYRIDYLDTEAGGRINVSYLPANEPACTWWSGKTSSQWPNYNDNPYRLLRTMGHQQVRLVRDGHGGTSSWWTR